MSSCSSHRTTTRQSKCKLSAISKNHTFSCLLKLVLHYNQFMPEYRRHYIAGGTYFFTVVTYQRQPILTSPLAREVLRNVWLAVQNRLPFSTPALCLLPEHLHCVWTLPPGDADYSLRWGEIKRLFTREYLKRVDQEEFSRIEMHNVSRQKRGEATIWQRRFWEHTLRNEEDFERHVEYIHYNPVKHGLVRSVEEWPWSSFHRYFPQAQNGVALTQNLAKRLKDMTSGE